MLWVYSVEQKIRAGSEKRVRCGAEGVCGRAGGNSPARQSGGWRAAVLDYNPAGTKSVSQGGCLTAHEPG